jgi:hypothetical protein
MSIANKFRKIRGRMIQDEAGPAVCKSDDINLKTVQSNNILAFRDLKTINFF